MLTAEISGATMLTAYPTRDRHTMHLPYSYSRRHEGAFNTKLQEYRPSVQSEGDLQEVKDAEVRAAHAKKMEELKNDTLNDDTADDFESVNSVDDAEASTDSADGSMIDDDIERPKLNGGSRKTDENPLSEWDDEMDDIIGDDK